MDEKRTEEKEKENRIREEYSIIVIYNTNINTIQDQTSESRIGYISNSNHT